MESDTNIITPANRRATAFDRRSNARRLLVGARWLSSIFRPEFFPMLGFVVLFLFTYLSLLPWTLKGLILFCIPTSSEGKSPLLRILASIWCC